MKLIVEAERESAWHIGPIRAISFRTGPDLIRPRERALCIVLIIQYRNEARTKLTIHAIDIDYANGAIMAKIVSLYNCDESVCESGAESWRETFRWLL